MYKRLCQYLISFIHIYCVVCFNIDTENVLIFTGKSGSEFGFTSGILENNQGKWLLVGAPKDNFTDVPAIETPGNVYKCPININNVEQTGCVTLTLRSGERTRQDSNYPYEETDQLLGANLLITDDAVVACASLWKHVGFAISVGLEYPIGFCYQLDRTLQTVTPRFYSNLNSSGNLFDRNGYIFANSMLGLSSAITEVPSYGAVLGAPGITDGIGGVIMYKTNDLGADTFYDAVRGDWDSTIANNFVRRRGSYLGYSIASGRFGTSSLPLIVAGAPHFSNNKGHVGTVLLTEFTGIIVPRKVLEGDTIGALFGASLLVADVNGDGLDDLLVASTLDSQLEIDQGKVDVYHGTGNADYITAKISDLRGMRKAGARFGTCLANIGDISDDGYNDIAIGAPFEDERVGAVYIFNGGVSGLNTQYSQRISGQEVRPGLHSFGWQISSALDVDNNQYGDFSVGAYMSDTTVILRSRPIVRITATINISTEIIPLNASGLPCAGNDAKPCLLVEVCFRYFGKGVPNGISVEYEVKADTLRTDQKRSSRIHFYSENTDLGDVMQRKNFMLSSAGGPSSCETHIGRTPSLSTEFYRNIEQEVRFEITFDLGNITVPGQVFPILDSNNQKAENVTARFEKECEFNCRPNLQLDMELGSNEVIVGETNEIIAIIELNNIGDPSYTTSINITTSNNTEFLGSQILLGSSNINCGSVINATLGNILCEIGAPFRNNRKVRFSLRLGTSRARLLPSLDDIDNLQSYVKISSHVIPTATGSEEIDFSDNTKTLQIPVRLKAVPEITGVSQPEQRTVSNFKTVIRHFYVIYNNGPSPLPATRAVIDIPVRTTSGIVFLQEQDIQVSDTLSCELKYPSNTDTIPTTTGRMVTMSSTTADVSPTASNVSTTGLNMSTYTYVTTTDSIIRPPLARSVGTERNVTCSSHICAYLNCTIPVLSSSAEISVQFDLRIDESRLPFNATDVLLRYVSKGQVAEPSHTLFITWDNDVMIQVITRYFASSLAVSSPLNIWVIVGGTAGGALLFIILGFILWKIGFFKRQKQEELQKYKRMSNLQQRRRTQLAASRLTLETDS